MLVQVWGAAVSPGLQNRLSKSAVQCLSYCPIPSLVKLALQERCATSPSFQKWVLLRVLCCTCRGLKHCSITWPPEIVLPRALCCVCVGLRCCLMLGSPNIGHPRALPCVCAGREVLLYHPSPLKTALHPSTDGRTPAVQLLAFWWWQLTLFL